MKKVLRAIKNFFYHIWKFIDKRIVFPFTKFVTFITDKFSKPGKKVEIWLSKQNTLLFISLIFAVGLFIMVDQKILFYSESSAEVLINQPVTAIYNEEAYVVEGLPETVDITLIGSKADLYIAKQSNSHEVSIDLTGLSAGTHKVSIKYNQVSSNISYSVNPSVATVIIYPKVSEAKTLTVDVLNQDSLDSKLVIDSVNLSEESVIVKGAQYKVDQVATVRALVDIDDIVTQQSGTATLKDVTLKAYDKEGNVVDVEVVPESVDATVIISSPSKEVPIKVVPVGDVAFGLAINSIESSESRVTVYGPQSILDSLNYIPIEVDVTGLSKSYENKLQIIKPNGIKYISINNVNVKITLDSVTDKDIDGVSIEYRNLGDGYNIQGVSAQDTSITVNIKGVSSVINSITADDIVAYLDLSGYGEGTHEIAVNIEGTDSRVQYQPKITKVKVKITKK